MKRFENRIQFARFNADSCIADFEIDSGLVGTSLNFYRDLAFVRKLHGVIKYVLKYSFDLRPVADQAEISITHLDIDLETLLANCFFVTFHRFVDDVARIKLLQRRVGISGIERSHPENVIDQFEEFFRVAVDRLENLLLLVSQSADDLIQQKIDEPYDDAERSSELVRSEE